MLTRIKLAATMTGYALVCWHCLRHQDVAHARAPAAPPTAHLALAPAPPPAQPAQTPPPAPPAPAVVAPTPAPVAEPSTAPPAPEEALDTASSMQRALDRAIGDRTVLFAPGSDAVDPSSFALLEDVAATLRRAPVPWPLEVSGHTDDVGNPAGNVDMSARRAAAVARFLAGRGISYRRVQAIGRGASRPIADNATPDGRARNRRIEFKVIRARR